MSDSLAILTGPQQPLVDAVVLCVQRLTDAPGLRLVQYRSTGGGSVCLVMDGPERFIAKLPLSPASEDRIRASVAGLNMIRSAVPDAPTPHPLHECEVSGQYFTVERLLPGAHATSIVPALPFLRRLCAATRSSAGSWGDALSGVAERYASKLLSAIRARGNGCCDLSEPVGVILSKLRTVGAEGGFRCAIHGDFWHANLLTSAGALTGVLDGERAESDSLPLLDVLQFLTRQAQGFGLRVAELRRNPSAVLARHAADVGVPLDLLPFFVAVYLLREAGYICSNRTHVRSALHANVCVPLQQVAAALPHQPQSFTP